MSQLIELIFSVGFIDLEQGFSPWWLLILYMIGAYIRKYGFFTKLDKHRIKLFLFMYWLFSSFTWLLSFLKK